MANGKFVRKMVNGTVTYKGLLGESIYRVPLDFGLSESSWLQLSEHRALDLISSKRHDIPDTIVSSKCTYREDLEL